MGLEENAAVLALLENAVVGQDVVVQVHTAVSLNLASRAPRLIHVFFAQSLRSKVHGPGLSTKELQLRSKFVEVDIFVDLFPMSKHCLASPPSQFALKTTSTDLVIPETTCYRLCEVFVAHRSAFVGWVDLSQIPEEHAGLLANLQDFLVEEGCSVLFALFLVLESEPARLAEVLSKPLLCRLYPVDIFFPFFFLLDVLVVHCRTCCSLSGFLQIFFGFRRLVADHGWVPRLQSLLQTADPSFEISFLPHPCGK